MLVRDTRKASIRGTTLPAAHFDFHSTNIAFHDVLWDHVIIADNNGEPAIMIFRRRALVYIAACAIVAVAVNAGAENSQQTKMTTCNADAKAKNLAGDD